MAIEFTEPAELKRIVYESFEINVRHKWVRLTFLDVNGEDHQFTTDPKKWNAALSFLFDNLTNAAELKDRIESYLVANEIIGGTIVSD